MTRIDFRLLRNELSLDFFFFFYGFFKICKVINFRFSEYFQLILRLLRDEFFKICKVIDFRFIHLEFFVLWATFDFYFFPVTLELMDVDTRVYSSASVEGRMQGSGSGYSRARVEAISKTDRDLSEWSIFRNNVEQDVGEISIAARSFSSNIPWISMKSELQIPPPPLLPPVQTCNRSTKVKFRAKISSEISLLLIKKFFDLSSVLDLPDIRNVNIRYDVSTLIACLRRV